MKKNKKIAAQTVKQPSHRDNPKGKLYNSLPAAFGIRLFSYRTWDLTASQVKAFRKMLRTKNLRRSLRLRSQPYLSVTKKPSEVRMGKGHGVKVNQIINPVVPGSSIFLSSFKLYHKDPLHTVDLIQSVYQAAGKKLPPKYKVRRTDI